MKHIVKLSFLFVVIALSYFVSSYFINQKLIEVKAEGETLASAMLKARVSEKLREAEGIMEQQLEEQKQAQKELKEKRKSEDATTSDNKIDNQNNDDQSKDNQSKEDSQIEEPLIKMEQLEMKDPVEKKDNHVNQEEQDSATNEALSEENSSKEDLQAGFHDLLDENNGDSDQAISKKENNKQDDLQTELDVKSQEEEALDRAIVKELAELGNTPTITYYSLLDETKIVTRSISDLTEEELTYYGEFLTKYYFLDGEYYCEIEQNQKLREKKEMVKELENYMIESYQTLNYLIEVMTTYNFEDVGEAYDILVSSRNKLVEDYEERVQDDKVVKRIYQKVLRYLDSFIDVVKYMMNTGNDVSDDSLFSYAFVMISIRDKIYTEVPKIMEMAVDAKSDINAVYLLNLDKVVLLSKEDAVKCLIDPGYVLYSYGEETEDTE